MNVIENDAEQLAVDLVKYCYEGDVQKVQELHALGADINKPDKSGEMGLHSAIRSNNDELASLLLSWNASPNILDLSGNDALHYAAIKNKTLIANELIKEGAFVNGTSGCMVPPIITASLYNNVEMVSFLIEHGAEINIKDKKGKSALYYAMAQKHEATVQMLLKAGAIPVKVNNNPNKKKSVWKRMFNS